MSRWLPRRRAVAARLPRRLAWFTVGALALVMTLGNIVSATSSGLGCPDWPLCHGRVLPPGGAESWLESRPRLAVPLFSVLLVATAVVTWRRAVAPALRRLAVALVGLLVGQIVLGGVTVLLGLSPLVSTVHLLTALTVLAGLVTICAVPDAGRGAAEGEPSNSTAGRGGSEGERENCDGGGGRSRGRAEQFDCGARRSRRRAEQFDRPLTRAPPRALRGDGARGAARAGRSARVP